jgi:acyl-coenzyme A synthetase/AMP-(fatty) acid ligase
MMAQNSLAHFLHLFKCALFCRFRYMFLAGEHCDHETLDWVRDRFQVPCLDHWWQTGITLEPMFISVSNESPMQRNVANHESALVRRCQT